MNNVVVEDKHFFRELKERETQYVGTDERISSSLPM